MNERKLCRISYIMIAICTIFFITAMIGSQINNIYMASFGLGGVMALVIMLYIYHVQIIEPLIEANKKEGGNHADP